ILTLVGKWEYPLTTDSMITLIGTVVTLGGAGITIWQSKEARNYKNQLKFDVRKINLTNVSERLKRAQDEIRRLPTSLQGIQRGTKPSDLIHKTKEYFDIALGTLDAKGPDADIRQLLVEAQKNLTLTKQVGIQALQTRKMFMIYKQRFKMRYLR
ncbi:TPA: hypothetical protein ACIEHN_004817, partial [Escherichia coli]